VHTPIHGVIENGGKRRNDLPVFPDLLKEVGYINIVSGKTHFGDVPEFFDINYATSGSDLYERHLKEHGFDKPKTHPNPVPEDLFYDAFVTSNTIKGIEEAQRNSDAPFFAFCSMIAPHYPLIPPGRWADLYTDEMLPHRHRSGTGRVSLQAGELIKSVCGTDAEERLNKKAQAIDEMFGDL
jgi:arylsulfatase A-like enzyme